MQPSIKLTDIGNARLINQQISTSHFTDVKELVGFMAAMQAQDYAMSKWAIGTRLPTITEAAVNTAINNGDIIRTHLLRPTWHWVSASDIYWMLDLVAAQVRASQKPRHKQLELTDKIFTKSFGLMEKALAGNQHLTREELLANLDKVGIGLNGERCTHLLVMAELEGLICSGAEKGNKQTYALLQERVPKPARISRDEALAILAQRYFTSHGPATVQDFIWWSGLSITEGKKALELVKDLLASEKIGAETYWLPQSFVLPASKKKQVHLLPAFDEFIISYKDRTASLLSEHFKQAVSQNGIFYPVIVLDGKVIGLWKRTIVKDRIKIETELFQPITPVTKILIEKAAKPLGKFLGKQAGLVIGN
jgi:hypothetical protein